jgi:hypothetical protein
MRRLAFVLLLLIHTACGKKPDESAPPVTTPATAQAPAPQPSGARTLALQPSQDIRGLVGSLQSEAAKRPAVVLTVEKAFDALAGAGVAPERRKQYLAATANASYCAGGVTREGIAVAVCEYPDAAAAEDGKKSVEAAWGKATPNARRVVHRSTMLTITPADTKQVAAVERAIGAFTSLQEKP